LESNRITKLFFKQQQSTTAETCHEDLATFCWWNLLRRLWHLVQMAFDDQQRVNQQWEASDPMQPASHMAPVNTDHTHHFDVHLNKFWLTPMDSATR